MVPKETWTDCQHRNINNEKAFGMTHTTCSITHTLSLQCSLLVSRPPFHLHPLCGPQSHQVCSGKKILQQ